MSFDFITYFIEANWLKILVGMGFLAVPVWIVYRPDLKLKKIFGEFFGYLPTNRAIFHHKNNRRRWLAVKNSIDPTSPESWRQAMKLTDKLFQAVLQKLEPQLNSEAQRLSKLCQENPAWLNVRSAVDTKNNVLAGKLSQINQSQIYQAMERFEKIFKQVDFI